jgi:hypothetical protein
MNGKEARKFFDSEGPEEREMSERDTELDTLAEAIKTAPDLWKLHEALVAFEAAAHDSDDEWGEPGNEMEWDLSKRGIDVCELPTFSPEWPKDTTGVWSWDDNSLLVGEGSFSEWRIVERKP